eukprot:9474028-Pyramimonas_sp.AAC.1
MVCSLRRNAVSQQCGLHLVPAWPGATAFQSCSLPSCSLTGCLVTFFVRQLVCCLVGSSSLPCSAGLEVDTNTKIGGVPPPREEDPDLSDGGNIVASRVAEILPPTPKPRIIFPCGGAGVGANVGA